MLQLTAEWQAKGAAAFPTFPTHTHTCAKVKRGNWEKAARSLTPQCPTISPSSDFGMKKEQLLLVAKKPFRN